MKPASFAYSAADSIDQAVALLSEDEEARILAGGQSLLPLLDQERTARVVAAKGLSVRATEALVRSRSQGEAKKPARHR